MGSAQPKKDAPRPYEFRPFPTTVYRSRELNDQGDPYKEEGLPPKVESKVIHSEAERDALGDGWEGSPADLHAEADEAPAKKAKAPKSAEK